MSGKEMMAVCEEKGLLVPHDDIPIIGLDGTVVKDTTVNYPTVFAIIVRRVGGFRWPLSFTWTRWLWSQSQEGRQLNES